MLWIDAFSYFVHTVIIVNKCNSIAWSYEYECYFKYFITIVRNNCSWCIINNSTWSSSVFESIISVLGEFIKLIQIVQQKLLQFLFQKDHLTDINPFKHITDKISFYIIKKYYYYWLIFMCETNNNCLICSMV